MNPEAVAAARRPWHFRWPDDFRDEVLAKLLELNRQRAEEERLSVAVAEGKQEHENQYEHDAPASEFPKKNQPNHRNTPPNRPAPQQKPGRQMTGV